MGNKKVFYLDPDERKWTMEDLGLHRNDFEDLVLRRKKIGGIFYANNGKIIKFPAEPPFHCFKCLVELKHNEEFYSLYCEHCDEWREENCDDPLCKECLARPAKPSDCN